MQCGACHSEIAWKPGGHLRSHPVARQLLDLPQRRAGAGQAADAYRDGSRVRRLPHHPHLGGRGVHPPGRHRQLCRVPQRRTRRPACRRTTYRSARRACEGCHSPTNFVTFAGTKINHPAVTALHLRELPRDGRIPRNASEHQHRPPADSRPNATLDKNHPVTGDCGQCHDTTTFANSALRPANHIPTIAPVRAVPHHRRQLRALLGHRRRTRA